MRLLFDNNLSPRLPARLVDLFPAATHVASVGLSRATDEMVWTYASAHDCVIVSKDVDFSDMGLVRGFPPKVIWLQIGNCTTGQIEAMLRHHQAAIVAFMADPDAGTLALLPP